MSALDRAWEFDREVGERAAGRIQRFELGAALFSDDLPRVYDANLIRFDRELDETHADEVERIADSLQHGLAHRKLMLPGGRSADRLAEEMKRRGWSATRTDVMEYRGPRERDPQRAAAAEEVDVRAVRGARIEAPDMSRDAAGQVADYTQRL